MADTTIYIATVSVQVEPMQFEQDLPDPFAGRNAELHLQVTAGGEPLVRSAMAIAAALEEAATQARKVVGAGSAEAVLLET